MRRQTCGGKTQRRRPHSHFQPAKQALLREYGEDGAEATCLVVLCHTIIIINVILRNDCGIQVTHEGCPEIEAADVSG